MKGGINNSYTTITQTDLPEFYGELAGVRTYTNTQEQAQTVILYMARYENNMLIDIKVADMAVVAPNENVIFVTNKMTVEQGNEGGIYRLLLWDNNLKPL